MIAFKYFAAAIVGIVIISTLACNPGPSDSTNCNNPEQSDSCVTDTVQVNSTINQGKQGLTGSQGSQGLSGSK